jgi:hypothetical protein
MSARLSRLRGKAPVKAFPTSPREVSVNWLASHEGTEPLKPFVPKLTATREVRAAKDVGIVPLNWFPLRSKYAKRLRLPISLGGGPRRALLPRKRYTMELSAPISGGSEPVRLLLAIEICVTTPVEHVTKRKVQYSIARPADALAHPSLLIQCAPFVLA